MNYSSNENLENFINFNNTNTTENIIVHEIDNTVSFETLHNDLGIIVSFLSFFAVLILCTLVYKFFKMFF